VTGAGAAMIAHLLAPSSRVYPGFPSMPREFERTAGAARRRSQRGLDARLKMTEHLRLVFWSPTVHRALHVGDPIRDWARMRFLTALHEEERDT
jgi:hypothetical protein